MKPDKKIKIYFGDLVHNFLGGESYMFPLNIGLIASYSKKIFGKAIEIKLFKYPDMLIEKLEDMSPDILGMSNYTWNSHLNSQISNIAKSINHQTIVVWGGPNINHTEKSYQEFFNKYSMVDFYIINEGEKVFVNLLQRYISEGSNLKNLKSQPIDGCVFMHDGVSISGKMIDRIEKLDDIPSPYLTGIFDDYFKYELIPIVETNRGCPYKCTYCAQGLASRHKVKYFNIERVLDELNYIADHAVKTNLLCFADANFGIAARDIKIAEHIKYLQVTRNYPRRCIINWIKTRQSLELAKTMGQTAYLISSLQSVDPAVLENIKRHNIDYSHFKEIIDHTNEAGEISGTEIILALPGETKESHLNSLRKLFNWDVSYIICYNCLLIDGSELTLPEQREKYKLNTKFRLIDSAFGTYGNIMSFECEEGIRSTSTMSEEEILFFRPIHWLIQFFWNYRCYFGLLKYLSLEGINPVDFIVRVNEDSGRCVKTVKDIFSDFKEESINEWFSSPEDLRAYYSSPENFKILNSGGVGKMNGKYTWRVILECKKDFDDYVKQTGYQLLPEKKDIIDNIVLFESNLLLDIASDFDAVKKVDFDYDIIEWCESRYKKILKKKKTTCVFYFSEEKKNALEILFNQYSHPNKNLTMRKMSEHMRIADLYYDVKPV